MSQTTPRVCSLPHLRGSTVSQREDMVDMRSVDLNLDGNADEFFTVNRKNITICGEMPKEAVVSQIIALFGRYDSHIETTDGGKITGPFWRAEYSISNNSTRLKTHIALPIFPMKNQTPFPLRHIDKSVREGDPVTVKGDGAKGVYFVANILITDAVRWDGKNMTVDYDRIQLSIISKAKLAEARNGKELSEEDFRVIHMSDIKSVEDRSSFPDFYHSSENE